MIYPRIAVLPFVFLASAAWFAASGQSVISTHSGLVYFFEGSVWLEDQPLEQKFGKFPDIGEGRELRTERGRAEVLLTPGVFLRMGENSRVRMLSTSLSDTRVELLGGSAIVESREAASDTSAVLVYKSWEVRLPRRGLCRLDSDPAQLRVYKGEAEVLAEGNAESVAVKEGQVLPLEAVLVTEQSSVEASDPLNNWAMERSQAVYEDNTTAAQIFDDPNSIDNSGIALGGLSHFPLTGIPALGYTSPYGLSFWSPFQSTLNSVYSPIHRYGSYYPGWAGGVRIYQPPRLGVTAPPRFGVGVHPGGAAPPRAPMPLPPRTPVPHGGVRVGGHR
jgi:hypothetical protein